MNESKWCTCTEFNALTEANHRRREEAQRQAERQAKANRYYKRIVLRQRVKTVATDLALIASMGVGLAVLLQLAIRCL